VAKTTPTQRTLAELKRRGWTRQVVEHWQSFSRRRIDLFGVIDVVALTPKYEDIGGVCCVLKRPYATTFGDGSFTCPSCLTQNTFRPGVIVGIQACAGASHAARRAKILAEPRAQQWLEAGARLEIWSFSKTGPRGKRKTWTLRIEPITVGMFADTVRREQG